MTGQEKTPAVSALQALRAAAYHSSGAKSRSSAANRSALAYFALCFLLTVSGLIAVFRANQAYAPEMYSDDGLSAAVNAFATGQNYAVFDLNLNIRNLRDKHLSNLAETPDLVVIGASHWQEANAGLVPHLKMYNAHIHRDYWEGPLAVTEMLAKSGRLPKKMMISIRDNQFTPVEARGDYLWLPDLPYFRSMAERLQIDTDDAPTALEFQRARELLSLSMLFENFTRWQNAEAKPHATDRTQLESLDVLLPDGSIAWSNQHLRLFTPERAKAESLKFAALNADRPPAIDPNGVAAFDKLLAHLKLRGVTVYLVNPPFNPIYYDQVAGTPYAAGLLEIEKLTKKFAATHGLRVIGGFNPHRVGCQAKMFIDAEHANAKCLKKIFDQFAALDLAGGAK
jgi:hypothetical protein